MDKSPQDQITTPYADVSFVQEGIIVQEWHHVQIDNMTLLEEHLAQIEVFIEHKPHAFLADLRRAKGISKAGRDMMASERVAKICKASAMLVSSNISRILATFFMKFYKTPFPIKIFSNKE